MMKSSLTYMRLEAPTLARSLGVEPGSAGLPISPDKAGQIWTHTTLTIVAETAHRNCGASCSLALAKKLPIVSPLRMTRLLPWPLPSQYRYFISKGCGLSKASQLDLNTPQAASRNLETCQSKRSKREAPCRTDLRQSHLVLDSLLLLLPLSLEPLPQLRLLLLPLTVRQVVRTDTGVLDDAGAFAGSPFTAQLRPCGDADRLTGVARDRADPGLSPCDQLQGNNRAELTLRGAISAPT